MANTEDDIRAWINLDRTTSEYMVAEFLPGRNFACHLLFHSGRLVKTATYERLKYFMGHTTVSGITGNICEGRLVNERQVRDVAMAAVEQLASITGESLQGLVAVDIKETSRGIPMITEINLRHVASTYSFAAAGFNLSQFQMQLILDGTLDDDLIEKEYGKHNMIFRDIDGPPVWVPDFRPLELGQQSKPDHFDR